MKRFLIYPLVMLAFWACSPDQPTDPTPNPEPEKALFEITVQEDQLAAFSVTFDIIPSDKSALYYCDIISKARIGEVKLSTIKAEVDAGVQKMAGLTGSSYDEVLEQMLSKGDQLNVLSNAGYRPNTDFCIYAFYWDATSEDELCLCEFSTPAKKESSESVAMSVVAADDHALTVAVEPSAGVAEYWYYFGERTKAEAMLAGLEDENAYLSYHAMNVSTRYMEGMNMEHRGLAPATEYMAIVMGIDKSLNRFMCSEVFATEEEQTQQRVESELFERLLGEWNGVQTITDLYSGPANNTFTVNILTEVEGVDYDYRSMNQLVATVDGWCNLDYYGVKELQEQEVEDAEEKWGPKWVFNIADGDVVTMDGKVRNSVVGWMFFGDCFMLNMSPDTSMVYTDMDFEVEVSEDYNTITIKSPTANLYPGLGYNFEGYGWMGYYYGLSDIVLTRK